MKYLTVYILISSYINTLSQTVFIPDAKFKAALVNSLINTNRDSEIQVYEAKNMQGTLNISGLGINSLTGIEAFTELGGLLCNYNNLTYLNLSSNTKLQTITCTNNNIRNIVLPSTTTLKTIDISNNIISFINLSSLPNLTNFQCYNNSFTNIDISSNTLLNYLSCYNNSIINLNLSTNTTLATLYCYDNNLASMTLPIGESLRIIYCQNNRLTDVDFSKASGLVSLVCSNNRFDSLNFSLNPLLDYFYCIDSELIYLDMKNGNNTNFRGFGVSQNPNLECVTVDDELWSVDNWTNIDSITKFSENCSNVLDVSNYSNMNKMQIYPNPTSDVLFVKGIQNTIYSIFNSSGEKVKSGNGNSNMVINLIELPSGIYTIKIISNTMDLVKHQKFAIKK